MSTEAFLLVSCAVIAAIFLCGSRRAPEPEPAEPPPDPGRWRRFRIHERALGGALHDPAPAVVEEPSGLRMDATPRAAATDPVRIAGPGGRPAVTVRRGWLLGGRFRVRIDGRPVLEIVARGGRLTARGIEGDPIETRGDMGSGNYEVRRGGRLVALCFRDGAPEGSDAPAIRSLEVLRDEDPVLPLALALGVEVALKS